MATRERIYIDEDLVPFADRMVGRQIPGSTSAEEYFRDTRELVAFAAGLGFRKKRFRPLKKAGREVKLSAVERIPLGGMDLVSALAVAHAGGVAILYPDLAKERAEILEGYVNGGLAHLLATTSEEIGTFSVVPDVVRDEILPLASAGAALDLLGARI